MTISGYIQLAINARPQVKRDANAVEDWDWCVPGRCDSALGSSPTEGVAGPGEHPSLDIDSQRLTVAKAMRLLDVEDEQVAIAPSHHAAGVGDCDGTEFGGMLIACPLEDPLEIDCPALLERPPPEAGCGLDLDICVARSEGLEPPTF